jgi:uncharacterized protein (TIGR02246 family)
LSPEETAVAAANQAFYGALQARDVARMAAIWEQDERVSCIHPGWHRLDGWTEVRRSWEAIFANSRPWSVSCEQVRVRLDGGLASVSCVEVIIPFGGKGAEAAARMQATNLFAQRDGRWRMVHHHASPFQAEAGAAKEPVN